MAVRGEESPSPKENFVLIEMVPSMKTLSKRTVSETCALLQNPRKNNVALCKSDDSEVPKGDMTFLKGPIANSLGPASLVGGTAAIYTSLLNHPSSTLTHLSFVFMMLLAVQYALQPRLSRKYIPSKANKQSIALVEEVIKTGMAAAIFAAKPRDVIRSSLQGKERVHVANVAQTHHSSFCLSDWSLSSSLAVAGLPAVLYAFQGVFQYVSHQHLDPVTFNGLTQTKTLSAAFCCWFIMGKPQSPIQIAALGVLFGSALVFQGYIKLSPRKRKEGGEAANRNDDWMLRGVVPCLAAAFLSGLAGALSQKGLQMTGISGRDPFLYTVEISFFSAITLLFNMIRSNAFSKDEWAKQKATWTWKALIPIIFKAAGGVVTALVHKYAGSVAKGFALMFGLVLSGTIQLAVSDETLQPHQILGTLMIMLSTWLHFTHPPV